jgi:hypothetical protein
MTNHHSKRVIAAIVGIIALAALLYGAGYWWLFPMYHHLWVFFRYSWAFLIILLVFGIGGLVLGAADHGIWCGVVWCVGAVLFICMFPLMSYLSQHNLYAASNATQTNDAESLAYDERTPYDVAASTSGRNLGTTNGDNLDKIAYIPALKTWTTTVNERGIGVGYDKIQEMKLPLIGQAKASEVSFCSFSDNAKRSLSGTLWFSSLAVQIARQTSPSVTYDRDDSFAVCNDGKPYVYVPLRTIRGGLFPYHVPAGVAVYDGSTGTLTIRKSAKIAGHPVYPMSVASAQRDSVKASGNMWAWMMRSSGYEDTSGDVGDPNASNDGEFSLQSTTGTAQYVSPLTPRGTSSSIVAVSTLDSDSVNDGELAPITLHMFPEGKARIANTTVKQNISAGILSGYKSTNLSIFEIVPSAKGEWTATIGNSQTTIYRAIVTSSGSITLKDEHGNTVASTDSNDASADSSSHDGSGTTTIPDDAKPSKPLSSMTTKELSDWSKKLLAAANDANAELANRAESGSSK